MTSPDDDELARLRASEERLRLAVGIGHVGTWEWYPQSGETYWDAECLRLWDLPAGASPSFKRFIEGVHPSDRDRVRGVIDHALDPASGGAYEVVFRLARDAEPRWVLARGGCLFDGDRKPRRFVGTLIDVTDRETLREDSHARARRSEIGGRLLRRLAESTTREESLRIVCEETALGLGVEMVALRAIDETTGLTSSAYIHGLASGFRAQPAAPTERETFLATHGDVAQFPDIADVPDLPGREQFLALGIRSMAHVRMVANGKTAGLLFALTVGTRRTFDPADLTFLRSSADVASIVLAHARVYERYQQIVTGMTEAVAICDSRGRIIFANPAAEAFFGAKPLTGRPVSDLWFEEDLGTRRTHLAAAIESGVPARANLRYRRLDDGREVWGSVAFMRFDELGASPGVMVIITDITETRKLEAKMLQAQKLESLGVLAGGIAHDFNNLLVGILGNAGLALDEIGPGGPGTESISQIEVAAVRAADLTRQLLAYAGKGRFVITQVDLRKLVEEMTQLVSALISKDVVLRYDFAPTTPLVEGDATQLRQVVMNLVSNAADAIGDRHGVITVTTRALRLERDLPPAAHGDSPLLPGDYVRLEVSDTGAGMSEETRAKIFDPFFTTKFTGRGLGLAAVLGILRAHRGAIEVDSELGRGTTFRLTLPAVPGSIDVGDDASSPAIRPGSSGRILVVDDDPAVRRVAQKTLERAGYEVLTASDGIEALERFRPSASEIDMVLLDVTMPRMGGVETFVEMRKQAPDVRVLVSSGFSESEATSHFTGARLAWFLPKPFTPAALLERVREVMSGA